MTVSDTAANIQALALSQIDDLPGTGASAIQATDADVTLTAAQAQAFESAKVSLSLPAADHASIADTAAQLQRLSATQIAGLGTLHVTQIAAADTGVSLTKAQAVALETAHIAVSAPSGSQVTLSDTSANLQAMTTGAKGQIQGLADIGITSIYSKNANVTFTAAQTSDIVAGNLTVSASGTHSVTETFTNGATVTVASDGAGGGTLRLGGNAVTVTSGPSELSVTVGTQTLPLTDYPVEAFTAPTGKTNETFIFNTGFGNDTINGFAASGTGHDVLLFAAASFGMSSSNTQAEDLAAMLTQTQNVGGSAVIRDNYGDTVTLTGVTKETLAANPADIKFTSGAAI